ncbi:MAG: hypothetical protein IH946_10585, partial [Bacteroidetes bacterium]|nr:hypothetical protein [Bacteroidota bacterium]
MDKRIGKVLLIVAVFLIAACGTESQDNTEVQPSFTSSEDVKLFELLPPEQTGVDFNN